MSPAKKINATSSITCVFIPLGKLELAHRYLITISLKFAVLQHGALVLCLTQLKKDANISRQVSQIHLETATYQP